MRRYDDLAGAAIRSALGLRFCYCEQASPWGVASLRPPCVCTEPEAVELAGALPPLQPPGRVEPIDPLKVLPVELGSVVIGCMVCVPPPLRVPVMLESVLVPVVVLDWAKAPVTIPSVSSAAQVSLTLMLSCPFASCVTPLQPRDPQPVPEIPAPVATDCR